MERMGTLRSQHHRSTNPLCHFHSSQSSTMLTFPVTASICRFLEIQRSHVARGTCLTVFHFHTVYDNNNLGIAGAR